MDDANYSPAFDGLTQDDAYFILGALMGGDPVPAILLEKLQAIAIHRERQIWIAADYERNRHVKGVGRILAVKYDKTSTAVYHAWKSYRHALKAQHTPLTARVDHPPSR